MTVFIVSNPEDYIFRICATKEAAERNLKELIESGEDEDLLTIEEYDLYD